MHRHRHAVIVLGGWLLMLAPLDRRDPLGFNLGAPISKWDQFLAYDTARECEESHLRLENKEGDGNTITARRMTMGRCVPDEAVYPPKPPAQK